MRSEHALVGRAAEMARIDAAVDGRPRGGVVLVGPAGVGKTRLAREVLASAGARGMATFWVAASTAAASIPFGAVAHLVPDVGSTDRLRVLRRAEQWLAASAGGRPVLLGVDDAHDLDDASAALVHRLATSDTAVVVATARAGVPTPDPVTALWKDGAGERVEVGPLDRSATAALAEVLLDGPLDGITQEQLWALSRGNALYLSELVRGGLGSGALGRRDGVWGWRGRVASPPHLVALVETRLADQDPAAREVVDLVALGEPLALALLERAGVNAGSVEDAERAGLVRTERGERPEGGESGDVDVRLAHPLYGDVARARTSPLRRRALCRRLADAVRPGDADPVRAATWHLDGGVDDPAVLAHGAARALAALDPTLAGRLGAAAVRAGAGPGTERLLAAARVFAGEGEPAEELLARLDATSADPATRAGIVAFRAWNLTFVLRRPDRAEAALAAAEARIGTGHAPIDAQRAVAHGYAGHVREALALVASVLESPDADEETTMRALSLRTQAWSVHGRYDAALVASERAAGFHRRLHGDDWTMADEEILAGRAGTHLFAGDLPAAEAIVAGALERSAAAGWHPGTSVWRIWSSDVALARGRVRTALADARESAALAATGGPYLAWTARLRALQRARLAALVGDPDAGAAALTEAAAWDDGTTGVLDVWGGSSAAWVAAARGELSGAVAIALAAAERARRDDQFTWEVMALHQVVRFGAAARAVDRLDALDDLVDGRWAPLVVRHARGAADGDGAGLDAVSAGFADLGFELLAAEAAAQAAVAHRSAGRRGSAAASTARARDLAARCEGARTPALALLTGPAGLTRRENEIARLATSGLTNRAVAERLSISVRTVDNTMHEVYVKLGVSGRVELGRLFDRG